MERFGNIDGRIIYTYRLPVAFGRRAVFCAVFFYCGKSIFDEPYPVYLKIKVAVDCRNGSNHVVGFIRVFQILGYKSGGFTHDFCEFEARQSVIAHGFIGRNYDISRYFVRRNFADGKPFRYIFSIIHNDLFSFAVF